MTRPAPPLPASAPSAPFDPGPDGHDTHLVLENPRGTFPCGRPGEKHAGGWMPRSGPAPHEACTRLVEESRG